MSLADELARLQQLRDEGALTEVEFEQAKRKAIEEHNPPAASPFAGFGGGPPVPGQIYGIEEKIWCVLMHLSQLLVASVLGVAVPIAMWLLSKDQSELARRQGNRMMNWLLSSLIYLVVGGMLSFLFIGIPLVFLVVVLDVVFPIIAAVKASNGEAWSYPLAIRFFPED